MANKEQVRTAEEVNWENRIAYLKNVNDGLLKQNETLNDQITEKRAQYELFVNQRDAETKQAHHAVVADREKLEADKAEFVKILNDLTSQKNQLDADKHELEIEKRKVQGMKDNLEGCITAIRRAVSLIS